MIWRDELGIQHDGPAPEGRTHLAGRWYAVAESLASVEALEPRYRHQLHAFSAVA